MKNSYLLDDEDVGRFIVDGHLAVKTGLPDAFHRDCFEKIEALIEAEGNWGNNILPMAPELQQVYDDPAVQGALTSLLGPKPLLHPHRYCHFKGPGTDGHAWHKDDYNDDEPVRHHRHRWVFGFYYPQDVTHDLAPTALLPRRQYHTTISDPEPTRTSETPFLACVPAGTVLFASYDAWHRGTANTSQINRCMVKCFFMRLHEPVAPTWNHAGRAWKAIDGDPHPGLSRHVWNWLTGYEGPVAAADGRAGDRRENGAADIDECIGRLRGGDEFARLDAMYELGARGEEALPPLMNALREEAQARAQECMAKSPGNPSGGNPSELYAAHALSAVGAPAVPALTDALADEQWTVRAAAADVLGNLGRLSVAAKPALLQCLQDDEMWVRRNAAEAIGTVGGLTDEDAPHLAKALNDGAERVRRHVAIAITKSDLSADSLVQPLTDRLQDEGRYARYFAATALRALRCDAAQDALFNNLLGSRWCPKTTKQSPY